MIVRVYKGKLFEEIDRVDTPKGVFVNGYSLDSNTGKRVTGRLSVPENQVTLTGDDQTCLRISQMSESELLDYVLDNSEYLSDPYYRVFERAIYARHEELRKTKP